MTEQLPQPAVTPLQRVDRDSFLANVRKSGLVPEDKLAKLLPSLPTTDKASTLARILIAEKLLTKFQAERLLVGRTDGFVMGQYRILDQLGRGGMGRVFKAEHVTMNRVVALKILNPALTKTDRARELFQREVRGAARLNHPNIVTAFDANQVADRHFLVMEFVDGPNLLDLVKEHGPLPIGQACEFMRQTAIGLQYAHDLGMVHRDIKPANLLVQRSQTKGANGLSTVKILDFGLARLHMPDGGEEAGHDSIETNSQSVMGTPDYLSPEQARNLHSVDGRSDLYSLGCTFYFLLTGNVPYPGGTTMEKLVRHTMEPIPLVRAMRPEAPVAVEQIVAKLMAKDPADRFQSANEFAEALNALHSSNESNKWVPIAPRPEDSNLPVSGANLPRPAPPMLNNPDPWAHLDEEDSALAHTLPGQSGYTAEATPIAPIRSSGRYAIRPQRKKSGGAGMMIAMLVLATAVVAGAVFAIKFLMTKAGS